MPAPIAPRAAPAPARAAPAAASQPALAAAPGDEWQAF
jgi:hypothetical protein